jgi:hypothetical protein
MVGVENAIDRDLVRLPEPESTDALDLFAESSKGLLFAVEFPQDEGNELGEYLGWDLYHVRIKFDRIVRLTSIRLQGAATAPTIMHVNDSENETDVDYGISTTEKASLFNCNDNVFVDQETEIECMIGSDFFITETVLPSVYTCSYDGMIVYRKKITFTYEEVEDTVGHGDTAGLKYDLLSMLEQQTDLHDVAFKCNGETLTANKAVVAGRCAYFRSMLFGNCRESGSDEIDMVDCPADAFRIILRFLYSGTISSTDPIALVGAHTLADKYLLPDCRRRIVENVAESLTIENALDAATHAYSYGLKEMKIACVNYIVRHRGETFLKMDAVIEAGADAKECQQLLKDVFARTAAAGEGSSDSDSEE